MHHVDATTHLRQRCQAMLERLVGEEATKSVGVFSRYQEGDEIVIRLVLFGYKATSQELPTLSVCLRLPQALSFATLDLVEPGCTDALHRLEHLCFSQAMQLVPLTAGDLAALCLVLPLARSVDLTSSPTSERPVVFLEPGGFV